MRAGGLITVGSPHWKRMSEPGDGDVNEGDVNEVDER